MANFVSGEPTVGHLTGRSFFGPLVHRPNIPTRINVLHFTALFYSAASNLRCFAIVSSAGLLVFIVKIGRSPSVDHAKSRVLFVAFGRLSGGLGMAFTSGACRHTR
ncbi:hypothetical protein HPP92_023087 [Vanilla planifolia]|uniref:Uncharacterized protein n=1 Tax=Vanilla planifolia TaxID=51239 RepID=A0A835PYP5_VANPL|nr:hypothetical protein HPP92_023087 [Vanilla planifolia]